MEKPLRKWLVCAACFLLLFTGTGLNVNVYSAAQPYILRDFGFTNTQLSAVATIRSAANMIAVLLIPAFYRRFGFRFGMGLTAFLSAAAAIIYAFASRIEVFYLSAVISGFGFGLASVVPATILLKQWFTDKLGTAVGIASLSTGIASIVFSPLAAEMIERCDLRTWFLTEAVICVVCGAAMILLVRENRQKADAAEPGSEKARPDADPLGPGGKLILYAGIAMMAAAVTPGFMYLSVLFTTGGTAAVDAAYCLSLFGLTLALGKWLFGFLSDRIGILPVTLIFGAALFLGAGLACLVGRCSITVLFAASLLFGLGSAEGMVGLPLWARDLSSAEQFPDRLRMLQFCYTAASLVFSIVPGIIADAAGSYVPVYIIFAVFSAASTTLILLLYLKTSRTKHSEKR